MIGTSALKIEYQTINDFRSAADYLSYMFGGIEGISYRASINPSYFQSYFRTSGLAKAKYEGTYNTYVSMNTFFRDKSLDLQTGRDVKHLKRLTSLYVDIDCYKVGLSKQQVLLALQEEYIQHKIPVPTFVIDSGRGIYLIWKLRKDEDRNAMPKWAAVQEYLTETLKELGADYACTDGARILRVPFSINSKSRSMVQIKEFNDVAYTLYEIGREFNISFKVTSRKTKKKSKYPYNHATEKQRKYVKDIAMRLGLTESDFPDFTNFHETDNWIKLHKDIDSPSKGYCYKEGNTYSLAEFKSIRSVFKGYCEDIRKLFSIRKGENCKREIALFLYRYFLREMKHDSEYALKETLAFNADLSCPFDESYVRTVTESADKRIAKGIPYAYRKSTIIKILEINKDELKELPFLSAEVKDRAERKKASNRRYYKKCLEEKGKGEKKESIKLRRESIAAMKKEGKTAQEIQEALCISRATYQRDIAAMSAEAVVAAVTDVVEQVKDNTVETVKTTAEAVSNALNNEKDKTIKKARAIISAIKNRGNLWRDFMYHFFSLPFIEKNCVAVPHSGFAPFSTELPCWLLVLLRHWHDCSGDGGD